MRAVVQQALDFVNRVYLPDVLLVASFYKDWASSGGGYGNFLSFGDFPTDNSGDPSKLWLPRGVIYNKNINSLPQPLDQNLIKEYVARSWYTYTGGDSVGVHPAQGQTAPSYNGPQPPYQYLNTDSKYSWLKAPRYNNQPMEVGPLARMLVAYAAGHARVRQAVSQVLAQLQVGPEALFSTLGRIAARAIETQVIAEQLDGWFAQLAANIQNNNLAIHDGAKWNPSTWPATATGWGTTESPRGALGHWITIKNGKIDNYQMVVATVWNGGPRDAAGQRGVWEQALIGTRVADVTKPVEILRTIHSFDPCMACAVHVVDAENREVTRVNVEAL
jgi:Ni,Fe-hydrogenase I large subunit